MEKEIKLKIKVLQEGLMNDAEKEPKTYTENEFIEKYGIRRHDEIADLYFDFHDDEKDENGHVKFWECGLNVEVWED